jgi:hypothetical protein
MTIMQRILTITTVMLGTMLTRFLPFLVFPEGKIPPSYIQRLGTVLPHAVTCYADDRTKRCGRRGNQSSTPTSLRCRRKLKRWSRRLTRPRRYKENSQASKVPAI